MVSPTQRSLAFCRDQGWIAEVTEHWNPYARIRQDLFGFIDILALREPGVPALGIQTTAAAGAAARVAKILEEPKAVRWLASGNEIEVWDWYKRAKPVDRKWWRLRRQRVYLKRGQLTVAEVE